MQPRYAVLELDGEAEPTYLEDEDTNALLYRGSGDVPELWLDEATYEGLDRPVKISVIVQVEI